MASFLTRSTVSLASAALIALAVVPAFAQPDETPPPPPEEMQPPPAETGAGEMRSRPTNTDTAPEGMRLAPQAQPPSVCRSEHDTRAEAEAYCGPILQCQPPTVVKCNKRPNFQDWICRCAR